MWLNITNYIENVRTRYPKWLFFKPNVLFACPKIRPCSIEQLKNFAQSYASNVLNHVSIIYWEKKLRMFQISSPPLKKCNDLDVTYCLGLVPPPTQGRFYTHSLVHQRTHYLSTISGGPSSTIYCILSWLILSHLLNCCDGSFIINSSFLARIQFAVEKLLQRQGAGRN